MLLSASKPLVYHRNRSVPRLDLGVYVYWRTHVNVKKFAAMSALMLASAALTGCSMTGNIASLEPYAPSDGVQVDVQAVKVRNLILIQGDSGKAVLIGSFVNSSDEDALASLQTRDANGDPVRVEFNVSADSKFDIGYNGTDPIALQLDAMPGQMHSVYVSAGSDPVELLVPVVDGSLEEYRSYADSLG
jgi:hypothetical protein